MKKTIKIILILLLILFAYGFGRGVYDANLNSKSSLLSIGLTINSMNPLSAFGYRIGIHTNPEIQERINGMKKDLDY